LPSQYMSPMTADDVDEVLAIENTLFGHPWKRTSFLDELKHQHARTFVVRNEKCTSARNIIAYIAFHLVFDEMHLLKIAVAKPWQHRGVATWMLQNCMQTAKTNGAKSVILEVRVSNDQAIMFYRKFGFQSIATRPNYYAENGEDALIMLNQLKEVDYDY